MINEIDDMTSEPGSLHDLNPTSPPDQDSKKRKRAPVRSEAAKFNELMLRRLQKRHAENPEADLQKMFPEDYSGRLRSKIRDPDRKPLDCSARQRSREDEESDIRSKLDPHCTMEVIDPLTSCMRNIPSWDENNIPRSVEKMLATSEVIYKGPIPTLRSVFKCGPELVVKAVWDAEDFTEYTMLKYLETQAPTIPAPRPLGALRFGRLSLIFTSYIPGRMVADIWPQLTPPQKESLMGRLELVLRSLRAVKYPSDQTLGGVAGEGCKDLRRHVLRSKSSIRTVAEHDEFLLSNARYGSKTYIDLLRSVLPKDPEDIRLSHGDFRPSNIIVEESDDGSYRITGLVDWEFGGFYPSHYECTKATNCLGTDEISDWYSYLPPCLSPSQQGHRWLWDYFIGRLVE